MSKPNILMVISQFPPESIGGAEIQCKRLSKAFSDRGYDVKVLTTRQNKTLKKKTLSGGFEVHRPVIQGNGVSSAIFTQLFKVFKWMIGNRADYDLVYIHLPASPIAFVGLFAAKKFGKPAIAKISNSGHMFDLSELEERPLGKLRAYYFQKHIDQVVSISSDIEEDLKNYGFRRKRISRIPNGVPVDRKEPVSGEEREKAKTSLSMQENRHYFLYVGSLEPRKNIQLLIKGFDEVFRRHSEIGLILVGDGSLSGEVKKLLRKLGIESAVVTPGEVKEVDPYFLASEFFILPSKTEGLSNALLEAMSFGLIPIVSKVSGSVDLIKNEKNGFLSSLGSPEDLAEVMETCLEMEEDRLSEMSKRSFVSVKESFSMESVINKYESLFEKLSNT